MCAIAAMACGDTTSWDDCESEIARAREEYGQPDSMDTLTDDSYHVVRYWWRQQGIAKTFTWSNTSDCKESTDTLAPAPRP